MTNTRTTTVTINDLKPEQIKNGDLDFLQYDNPELVKSICEELFLFGCDNATLYFCFHWNKNTQQTDIDMMLIPFDPDQGDLADLDDKWERWGAYEDSIVRMEVNWTEQALRTLLEVYYSDSMGWIWENGNSKEKAIVGTIQQMRNNPAENSRVTD